MRIEEFQTQIERLYLERDSDRGVDGTFRWFVEEVGELAKALRNRESHRAGPETEANLREEFADVFAWLATLASLTNIRLEDVAMEQYGEGCPKCRATPCSCAIE